MLNEVSPELVGKVNKARLLKPAKSAAARKTLDTAVKKAWLKSKVGTIKEAVKAAGRHDKGPFAIATKTRGGGLRRVPDTRFDTWDSANKYGLQYHTDRYGAQMFVVIQHPDAKKKLHEDLGGGPGGPTTGGIANVAGDATSNANVHWSKRQPNIGPKGPRKKYGQPIMFKAIVRRMTGEQTVFYKALGKRVKAVSRTSAMGGGSDGSSGNGSEQVQREHANGTATPNSGFKEHIVKAGGGYRLVSKKTGKNLGTYPTRAGAERRERQVQYFKHKG